MKFISRNENEGKDRHYSRLIITLSLLSTVFFILSPIISAFDWTNQSLAYWRMEENTGDITYDSIGIYNLALNNSGRWVPGKIGNGINVSYNLQMETNDTTNFGEGALSFTAWIYPTTDGVGNWRTLTYKFHPSYDGSFAVLITDGGNIRFSISTNSGGTTYCSMTDLIPVLNQWNFVAATYDGSVMKGYLNNTLSSVTCAKSGTIQVAISNLSIGYNNVSGQYLYGIIDEVGIWKRALPTTELTELWNSGAGLTYVIDETNLIAPTNETIGLNKSLYFTANHASADLKNTTLNIWYSNGTLFNSTSIALTGTTNQSNISFGNWQYDNYYWGEYTCYVSSCSNSANRTLSINKAKVLSEGYNAAVSEGSVQAFNITLESDFPASLAYLIWNGTSYLGTIDSTAYPNITISKTGLSIPDISSSASVFFNWSITLSDSSLFNSTTHTQAISTLGLDNCSTFTQRLLNYTLKDELTQTELNGTASNGTIDIFVNIYPLSSTTAITSFSQQFTTASKAAVCINSSLVGSSYRFDSTVKYSAIDYQTEYNILRYSSLTSSDLNQNVSLLDLPTASSTTFKITYKDTSFLPVSNAVIDISRQYISEGVFKTVERPITDYEGKTTSSLIKDTGIYNFYVYRDNVLLATFLNVIPVCQNPTITDCTIDLNSFSSSVPVTNFTSESDFLFTLANNRTSRVTTLSFSIPSGSVATIVLNVTKSDALGTNVCTTSTTTSAGTLSCTYSASIGNSTLMAKVYKDGVLVGSGQLSLDLTPSEIWGGIVVFLAIFLIITLAGAGISDNPVFTIIFFMIGVILLFVMNLVAHNGFIGAGATILWLIMAIIIVIAKGAKRQ